MKAARILAILFLLALLPAAQYLVAQRREAARKDIARAFLWSAPRPLWEHKMTPYHHQLLRRARRLRILQKALWGFYAVPLLLLVLPSLRSRLRRSSSVGARDDQALRPEAAEGTSENSRPSGPDANQR